MEAVFRIAYRTNSEDDAYIGGHLLQKVDTTCEIIGTLLHRKDLLREEPLRTFLTVIHNLTRLVEDIHMIGTQGKHRHIGHGKCRCSIRIHPLQRMQHTGRIIHHTEGVHCSKEHVIGKPFPDIVGKAAAHEEQLVMRFHLPR